MKRRGELCDLGGEDCGNGEGRDAEDGDAERAESPRSEARAFEDEICADAGDQQQRPELVAQQERAAGAGEVVERVIDE